MCSVLRWLRHRLPERRAAAETSRLIVGATGSGKSEGELADLVRIAGRRDCAVVLVDGHGPLAFSAAGHWAARGHEARLVYEPLEATDRVLCWSMLARSSASSPSRRRIEDAERRDEVAQCFMAQRDLGSLRERPWTQEWLHAVTDLCLAQPQPVPLPSLLDAFRVGSEAYERLLSGCDRPEITAKFRDLERVRYRNPVQYEQLTGAARRLLEPVCTSEVLRLRSRPGPFDWLTALRSRSLVAIDGGGVRSPELKRALFLLVGMHVIHAVRQHAAQTGTPLPVVLVLEEAGALSLVTPFVVTAVQELRKAGLAVHLITQSSLDFGDRSVFESLLANVPWQAWHQCLAPADQELGAKALANATFQARSVHFLRCRALPAGTAAGSQRAAMRPRYREIAEPYFKTPQLHEQEYRTRLATLRVGERLVRDRRGVYRERTRLLTPPRRLRNSFAAFTRDVIARVRARPIYLPCPPEEPAAPARPLPDAAARLRGEEGPRAPR